jgi:hypothetical protein
LALRSRLKLWKTQRAPFSRSANMSDESQSGTGAAPCTRPSGWYWLLPAVVAFLRTLPFLSQQFSSPPAGYEYIGVSYIPKDFLAYLAFIRQVGDNWSILFYNPFSTSPQTPSFILLFHWILGAVSAILRVPPNWVLELSRFPLLLVFFWMLWLFLAPLISSTKTRCWACILIGISGGLECFVAPLTGMLHPEIVTVFRKETWDMYGWSTFAGFFNPLWIMSMTLGLLFLPPLLKTQGALHRHEVAQVFGGFLFAYFIHPYVAVFFAALGFARPAMGWILNSEEDWKRTRSLIVTLAIALLACVAVGQWQSLDPVYRNSSAGIFGVQNVSIFWWPLTLGVVGILAIRGFKHWCVCGHPYREPMFTWIITVILLMTSPVINGYKFVFLIHLPLCILAAGPVGQIFDSIIAMPGTKRWLSLFLFSILLFSSPIYLTLQSVRAAKENWLVPLEYFSLINKLAVLPTGNVLAPPDLGNIIPAYTRDRVWVGQWFLTPYYQEKAAAYQELVSNPKITSTLDAVLEEDRIRYFILPKESEDRFSEFLGKRIQQKMYYGSWVLLILGPP